MSRGFRRVFRRRPTRGRAVAACERRAYISATPMSADAVKRDGIRLDALVASATAHAFCTFDREHRLTGMNAGVERMTGYRAEELIGELAARLYTPED